MSLTRRIFNCIAGVLMLICAGLLLGLPESGYFAVVVVMDFLLIFSGVRLLIYYFFMARHMVDGLKIFFKGVLYVDLGIFAIGLNSISKVFVILYLIGIFAVKGGLRAFKALDSRKQGVKGWTLKLIVGVCSVIVAILSLIYMKNPYVLAGLLSICLVYAGVRRIVTAFKKSAIVHVEM